VGFDARRLLRRTRTVVTAAYRPRMSEYFALAGERRRKFPLRRNNGADPPGPRRRGPQLEVFSTERTAADLVENRSSRRTSFRWDGTPISTALSAGQNPDPATPRHRIPRWVPGRRRPLGHEVYLDSIASSPPRRQARSATFSRSSQPGRRRARSRGPAPRQSSTSVLDAIEEPSQHYGSEDATTSIQDDPRVYLRG